MDAHDPQTPLNSPFGFASTAADVVTGHDLTGRYVVVTGGHSGLGLETVRALATAGATVIVGARDPEAALKALAPIPGRVGVGQLDLADLNSVAAFAERYLATGFPVHSLINNAGIMACPETRVGPYGWEAQLATNHHGHFVLTMKLLPALRRAAPDGGVRVVNVSSVGHVITGMRFHDPHFRIEPYDKWQAYGQSKTANALFAVGLDQRVGHEGIRAFSLHPGGIITPLQRHMSQAELDAAGWVERDGQIPPGFKTPQQGAATTVWCATSPLLEGMGGLYAEDCNIARRAGPDSPRYAHVRDWALDRGAADHLWWLSEYETGVKLA
jgi:NAD(P)-dependent dehydrogenase (short-subunit alcohol dehydrogenase family)